jgi:FG-GAP repeat protein
MTPSARPAPFYPFFLIAVLSLSTTTISAQTGGGGMDILYRWNGVWASDAFGSAVATAGDVNLDGFDDVLVGAEFAVGSGGIRYGKAFVFSGVDGSQLIEWQGEANEDRFGRSVAAAGDVNADGVPDLLVGAPLADPGGLSYAGSVYLYSGADGTLLYQWNGRAASDQFGDSVAGIGDLNQDGYDDVLVGSPGGQSLRGWADILSGADGSILFQLDGWTASGVFGTSVSSAGDVNRDGRPDVIIGSPSYFGGPPVPGSAHVYSGADGTELYRFDGEEVGDQFGFAVSGGGDLNGDGYDDLIVGAHLADVGILLAVGKAYAYSGADGTLLYQWNGKTEADNFGSAVANAGDTGGDGTDNVLVGAFTASPGGIAYAGSAYLYSGADGSTLKEFVRRTRGGRFGVSVATAGDLNRDGRADVIIGSSGARSAGQSGAGSAFAYGLMPFLRTNTSTVSAATGGPLVLDLAFPADAKFNDYKILFSNSGTGPLTYGINIPLSLDRLVLDSFFGHYPFQITANLHGTLDFEAKALIRLPIPAGLPTSSIGRKFYFAAISIPAGQLPQYSSVAATLTITP